MILPSHSEKHIRLHLFLQRGPVAGLFTNSALVKCCLSSTSFTGLWKPSPWWWQQWVVTTRDWVQFTRGMAMSLAWITGNIVVVVYVLAAWASCHKLMDFSAWMLWCHLWLNPSIYSSTLEASRNRWLRHFNCTQVHLIQLIICLNVYLYIVQTI